MDLAKLRARLAEILGSLSAFENLTDFTQEQLDQLTALKAEHDQIVGKIQAAETIESMKKTSTESTRKAPSASTEPVVNINKNRIVDDPKLGYENAGSFFLDVAKAKSGNVSEKLRAANGANEKVGEDGGYLVPPDFSTEIQKKCDSDESLLPLTRQFKTKGNSFSLPIYEQAPWGSTGVQAYWEQEAGTYAKSKPGIQNADLKLHKLTALVPVTEELLEDAVGIESFINEIAPDAIVAKINNAIISGTGAGQPLGILNSTFKVKVAKVLNQTADTVNFENVNSMLGRLLPGALPGAFWMIHPAVWPQIRGMKFDTAAASPVPVYMPPSGISGAPYGSLYGLPVKGMMGGVKAIGDEGDIILANLKYYSTVMKTSGINQSVSTHVYFDTDEVAYKFRVRLAGQCHFKSPVSPQNGSFDMSGIITLEDR